MQLYFLNLLFFMSQTSSTTRHEEEQYFLRLPVRDPVQESLDDEAEETESVPLLLDDDLDFVDDPGSDPDSQDGSEFDPESQSGYDSDTEARFGSYSYSDSDSDSDSDTGPIVLPPPGPGMRYLRLYQLLNDRDNILREFFVGFYTGDGIHGRTHGGIAQRSTLFPWIYHLAITYGIENPTIRYV